MPQHSTSMTGPRISLARPQASFIKCKQNSNIHILILVISCWALSARNEHVIISLLWNVFARREVCLLKYTSQTLNPYATFVPLQ